MVGAVIFTLPDCAYSWQQFLWANQFQHTIALSLTRCSISLLFMRLFYTHMFPKLRAVGTLPGTPKLSSILHMPMLIVRLAWVCIAASLACLLIMMIVLLLRCRPVHYNWSKPLENAEYCYPLKPTIISLAGFGLIIDGVTWIMPHFVVWTLQLRRAHKIAITSIFALGILCEDQSFIHEPNWLADSAHSNIVIGISRITALADLSFTSDITYDVVSTMIWDMAQVSTAMILACCPLLRPVFERLIPKGLTRMATKITAHRKSSSIRVTTRIDVRPASIKPRLQSGFHDGFQETEGPTFEVERSFVVC